VGVALAPDLGGFQNAGVAQLHLDLLPVKAVGLPVVVGLDAAHKVGLAGHHLGQQVHQRVLEGDGGERLSNVHYDVFIESHGHSNMYDGLLTV